VYSPAPPRGAPLWLTGTLFTTHLTAHGDQLTLGGGTGYRRCLSSDTHDQVMRCRSGSTRRSPKRDSTCMACQGRGFESPWLHHLLNLSSGKALA
jgi:hypothetical protein